MSASSVDLNDGTFTELKNTLSVDHLFSNPKMAWKTVYLQYKDTVSCFESKAATDLFFCDRVGTRVYVKILKRIFLRSRKNIDVRRELLSTPLPDSIM